MDKAELFGPCDFVVGADTITRVLNPKYYGGLRGLEQALKRLKERRCGFVVAGRLDNDLEQFVETHQAVSTAPEAFKDMFLLMPEFRMDISSTELRAARDQEAR